MRNDGLRARRRPLPIVLAFYAVVRAGIRVWWHDRRASLPELVQELSRAPRDRKLDAGLAASILERLLPWLPPFALGVCVKRSLLLVDLWSRSGLEPRLHIGIPRGERQGRTGHAWVTTRFPETRTLVPDHVIEVLRP